MTMCTMTADTTSSAAPWPSEMNQNARVARAWRAVKLRASTSRVVAAPAKSPSGRSPYASGRSEEHTSELQSLAYLVCRLLLEKKKKKNIIVESTRVTQAP